MKQNKGSHSSQLSFVVICVRGGGGGGGQGFLWYALSSIKHVPMS